MRTKGLTPKQELFCQVYVSTGNATEAYKKAYDTSNMKYTTILDTASKQLKNPYIAHRVKELEAELLKRLQPENLRAKVVEVCSNIVNADVTDMFDVDEETGKVKMKNVKQLPKDLRTSIRRITNNKGVVSFEFYDKTSAGDRLAKMFGFDAAEKSEVSINGGEIDVQIKQ